MSTPPSQAAPTFVAACQQGKLPFPSTKARQQTLLKDAGVAEDISLSNADVKERAAALVWLRHAVANNIPPDTWSTLISPTLLANVRTLYPIPPAKSGADPAETDLHRLAKVVSLFMPDVPTSSSSATPTPPAGGINVQRPPDPSGASSGAPPSSMTTPPAPLPAPPALAAGAKRKYMMHDELFALLPDAVYTALDACAHLKPAERAKLQKACKEYPAGALYDPCTGAPFGHQLQLSLAENAHFDAAKRGLALAIAGRSAGPETSGVSALLDATNRRAILQDFAQHWTGMEHLFGGPFEISGTNVSRLWDGVSFIMQARAARATSWNCPEVEAACKEQFEGLPAYRAAVASAVSRAATALPPPAAARSVNKAYLQFFLPFWWEHVLVRPRTDDSDYAAMVKEFMARVPPPAYVPPALPAPAPTPAPAPAPAPGPAPAPPPPPRAPRPNFFLGQPFATLLGGTDIGFDIAGGRACVCAVSANFPGRTHRPFECPIRIFATHNKCPGWTAAGTRAPGCWNGDVLTPACRAEWRAFAPTLPLSDIVKGRAVNF